MAGLSSGVVARKLRRLSAVPRRRIVNRLQGRAPGRPPVIANSVPKSGTHLLLQVLGSLPGMRPWGLFLASQPSFRFENVAPERMAKKIRTMADRELAGAHLYWSESVERALADRGTVHFLIYRDPRDVVVSEAHYLAEMNRWHRLHGRFRSMPDLQSRIRLSITGLDPSNGIDYPDISERYRRFLAWFGSEGVCAVRYEDLSGESCRRVVSDIVTHWTERDASPHRHDALVTRAMEAIRPERSHTFRSGGSGKWRDIMDAETRACFVKHAESLVVDLGYPGTE
ncbi:MAG: hypothetical protein GVY32_01115 [Gammaproteobacteria bacterium]|jgi:hypothetical protein|nr:hypothetical protein [Gammaproteobacteria bacterium]